MLDTLWYGKCELVRPLQASRQPDGLSPRDVFWRSGDLLCWTVGERKGEKVSATDIIRIFVASPGDVQSERDIVVSAELSDEDGVIVASAVARLRVRARS